MYKITKHPILDIAEGEKVEFIYDGKKVVGQKGYTIAAALHQAGFPVHSHSLDGRNRSLNCGIGKCGACEMLVDGKIRRICITKVDGVKEVRQLESGKWKVEMETSQLSILNSQFTRRPSPSSAPDPLAWPAARSCVSWASPTW